MYLFRKQRLWFTKRSKGMKEEEKRIEKGIAWMKQSRKGKNLARIMPVMFLLIMAVLGMSGCGRVERFLENMRGGKSSKMGRSGAEAKAGDMDGAENIDEAGNAAGNGSTKDMDMTEAMVIPLSGIRELENGFSAARVDGDYRFDDFLAQGGAASDGEVVRFLASSLLFGADVKFSGTVFGCSTIAAENEEGERLFGRNFDWNRCEVLVLETHPENGFSSISMVNTDFIRQGAGGAAGRILSQEEILKLAAVYAPLDGMNEMGLAVSVNMIQDSASIEQNTEKPDLTTTTLVRLLLDKAADVEEALELLCSYDLHGSMGMMVHFALADRSGRSVAVEYIDNEMVVIDTPVVTNFYFAEGEKQGIGTAQSHERYEILTEKLTENPVMDMTEMRDALDRVSKDNFNEFASTEWSIVFNLESGEAHYYHRENYQKLYVFRL